MSEGSIEVSREVMIAFGQAALVGNLKKLSNTDRKIIQTMMDGLLYNQQSVILDCNAMHLDKMMAKLASAPVENSSKLKKISHGFAMILGRRIPAEKLKLYTRAAMGVADFETGPRNEATFKKMIESKKEYIPKRPQPKKTGKAAQKMKEIVAFPERREMQVRQAGKEVAYLDKKRQKVFAEFEDFQIIKNLWASINKLPRDSLLKYRDSIISRMGLLVEEASKNSDYILQVELSESHKKGDYSEIIAILEKPDADPYRAARLLALWKCKNNLETYLLAKREPDTEAWRKKAWSDLKKKDKELKQLENTLNELNRVAFRHQFSYFPIN